MKPSILVSVVCVPLVSSCGPHLVKLPNEIPAAVQMQLAQVSRVWVAGFVSGPNFDRIDLNLETVRLLRYELRAVGSMSVVEAEPLTIPTERVFADDTYWRRLGDEHGSPLIVTGSLKLVLAPPVIVQRGRRTFYVPTAGRVLDATIVTIDGRTGRVIKTTRLPGQVRYGVDRFSSGLSLFFELMRQSRAEWFKAIAGEADTTGPQKPIRGILVLRLRTCSGVHRVKPKSRVDVNDSGDRACRRSAARELIASCGTAEHGCMNCTCGGPKKSL
jgi:hypothetical protein